MEELNLFNGTDVSSAEKKSNLIHYEGELGCFDYDSEDYELITDDKEADFDAESQTIYIDKTPNKTGDRTVMFLSILAGMLGLGVVTLFVTKRKKK